MWDVTVPDTLAPSYRSIAVSEAGAVAAMAESRKSTKYGCLPHSYLFSPVAVESFGAFGPKSLSLLFELGRRIRLSSGDAGSMSYMLQCFSVTLQRCNALMVMDSLPQASLAV